MNATDHTYTFENRSNSYFMGSDVVVTRDDGAQITINGKDGMVAVNVKDHSAWSFPDDVKPLAADLNRANRSRMAGDEYGREDWTDILYEQAQERWWEDAHELAQEAGFGRVWSSGRSGGWCCIDGTNGDRDWPRIAHPEDEDDREFRDQILQLLFDIHSCIESTREHWFERIREEHAELEARREANIIRGTE